MYFCSMLLGSSHAAGLWPFVLRVGPNTSACSWNSFTAEDAIASDCVPDRRREMVGCESPVRLAISF